MQFEFVWTHEYSGVFFPGFADLYFILSSTYSRAGSLLVFFPSSSLGLLGIPTYQNLSALLTIVSVMMEQYNQNSKTTSQGLGEALEGHCEYA